MAAESWCSRWTGTPDVTGDGGVYHRVSTLDQCKSACENENGCVAIDWNANNHAGEYCYLLDHTNTEPTGQPGAIIHYQLNRTCTG